MDTKITYLGGATYLLEIGSFRILTDPGFDPDGTERSEGPGHELKKNMQPPIAADAIGPIDAVLLSHAQHYDNLDNTGKAMLPLWGRVLTTPDSARALGGNAEPLETWASTELTNGRGETIRVTATPAIHTNDPSIRDAVGETTGFVLEWDGQENGALYISGDTVWTADIEEIGKRFDVGTAILHMGAANVPAVGDVRLTMDGEEGAKVVSTLDIQVAFPAHFEGWLHYKQGRDGIESAFDAAGVRDRLRFLTPGESGRPSV